MNTQALAARVSPALAGVFVWGLLVLFMPLLAGCASPQTDTLQRAAWMDLPRQAEIRDVPFFAQEDYACGPAALAMVLNHAGLAVTPAELQPEVFVPQRKGAFQLEMLAATRRHGLPGYVLAPSEEYLFREVAKQHPVVVFLNLSFDWWPVWHYAVVTGYDLERNTITLHSGPTAHQEVSFFTFDRLWARGQRWAMVALPATELPATAALRPYTAAIAALERINPAQAGLAYAAALRRWPDDKHLLLGQGNAAYATGDLPQAIAVYQKVVSVYPEFADAWNNLAQTYLDTQQLVEAAQAIAQAVRLGGARQADYQALARDILAKQR